MTSMIYDKESELDMCEKCNGGEEVECVVYLGQILCMHHYCLELADCTELTEEELKNEIRKDKIIAKFTGRANGSSIT
jgi:hypothetical protein